MDLPTQFTQLDLSGLWLNDTLPSDIDLSPISYLASADGYVPYSVRLHSNITHVAGDQGWTTVDTVFIQLDTSLTPSGQFPTYWNESFEGRREIRAGLDAAVCVQRYEPWIVESYNSSTGSAFALGITGKGDSSTSLSPSGSIQGERIENAWHLNSTGKDHLFYRAHLISFNRWEEAIYNQGRYLGPDTPTPTIVSFTDGTGLEGYTELSPDRFGVFLARANAVNILQYLVGSGSVVAQSYEDETLAYTTFTWWQMVAPLVAILILGIIGELFVPTLPHNIPRRAFGTYSWLALLQSQELQLEAANNLGKFTSLGELEDNFSDKRVKFAMEEDEV